MRGSRTTLARRAWRGGVVRVTTALPRDRPRSQCRSTRSWPALPPSLPAEASTASRRSTPPADAPVETVDRLRRWRLETARAASVPAYVVFHDSTLNAIAAARPASLADLLRVPGVGDSKLRKYGEEVLQVLRTPAAGG